MRITARLLRTASKVLLTVLPLTLGACQQAARNQSLEGDLVIVGTYTDSSSHGIYSLRLDRGSLEWHMVDSTKAGNPSFLALDRTRNRLYAVQEEDVRTAALESYDINLLDGTLQKTGTVLTRGADPCHVELHPGGRMAYTANYTGGSLSVISLDGSGAPDGGVRLIMGTANKVDPIRQEEPHVHTSRIEKDGGHILFTDFSADRVVRMALDADGNIQESTAQYAILTPGSGPRHIELSKDGRLAYVISELSEAVSVIRLEDMKVLQEIQAHEIAGRLAADIHLDPDGRHLYASIRGEDDGIATFNVDPATGLLELTSYITTGIHPRNFCITPDGKLLLAACRDSDEIEIYSIDQATGALTRAGSSIRIAHPVYVQLIQD